MTPSLIVYGDAPMEVSYAEWKQLWEASGCEDAGHRLVVRYDLSILTTLLRHEMGAAVDRGWVTDRQVSQTTSSLMDMARWLREIHDREDRKWSLLKVYDWSEVA